MNTVKYRDLEAFRDQLLAARREGIALRDEFAEKEKTRRLWWIRRRYKWMVESLDRDIEQLNRSIIVLDILARIRVDV